MSLSDEQITNVLANAPEDSVSVTLDGKHYINSVGHVWDNVDQRYLPSLKFCGETHRLADLKRISELQEKSTDNPSLQGGQYFVVWKSYGGGHTCKGVWNLTDIRSSATIIKEMNSRLETHVYEIISISKL